MRLNSEKFRLFRAVRCSVFRRGDFRSSHGVAGVEATGDSVQHPLLYDISGEVMRLTDETLQRHLVVPHDFTARSDRRRERLNDWLRDRRNEVRAIVSKALDHFSKELREGILDMVKGFKGAEFREFIQERIPAHVKRRCKNWIESHSPPITALLQQIDRQISSGLSQEFQTVVNSLIPPGPASVRCETWGRYQVVLSYDGIVAQENGGRPMLPGFSYRTFPTGCR
jgi:hypothetical protein